MRFLPATLIYEEPKRKHTLLDAMPARYKKAPHVIFAHADARRHFDALRLLLYGLTMGENIAQTISDNYHGPPSHLRWLLLQFISQKFLGELAYARRNCWLSFSPAKMPRDFDF